MLRIVIIATWMARTVSMKSVVHLVSGQNYVIIIVVFLVGTPIHTRFGDDGM